LGTRIAASPDILYLMTTAIRRAFLALVPASLALAMGAAHPLAEQQDAQAPVFRSGVELVAVDFMALSADGAPIIDLKPEEVTLRVDGRTRLLRSLQWIQVAGTGLQAADWVPPPFGSNTASDAGRGIIIVLDDESLNTGREAPLRSAVRRFLSALTPRDRVALVTMPYGGVRVDFTNEHDKVTHVLGTIAGQASRTETGSDAACRTRRTLESLVGLLEGLGQPEGPTTVMFFTTGLSGPRRDAPLTLAPGRCELTVEQFQQVGFAAIGARAQFYVIQPEDPALKLGPQPTENIAGAGFLGSENQFEGIEHLSGVTAARRLHLSTAGDETLGRIVRETSGYYLISFVPDRTERNGQRHRLDISVARPGTLIRARPEIVIARADARGRQPNTPQNMLREPKVFRELPMRAVGFVSKDPTGNLKVIAMAEPIEPGTALRSAAAALFDGNGRLSAQSTADATALSATPVITGLVTRPGAYRLRVAATDESGRAGTADYDLEAELAPAGPLTLSSMMVGISRGGGFSPRLQFGSEPVALAYLEIYGPTGGAPISMALEIATSPNAPAKLSIPGAVADTRSADRHLATAAIPIGGLPPGDYVIRAIVSMQGQPSGRVVRTIRKVQ
jgi:VWFA-related protein